MLTFEEISAVVHKPKSASLYPEYVAIYQQLTGLMPAGGCASCRLQKIYNTLWDYVITEENNRKLNK